MHAHAARAHRPTTASRPLRRGAGAGAARARRPLRYAVVGLGYIAQARVLPSFAHARGDAELVALVSDDAVKRRTLARRYGVASTYGSDEFAACLASGIDAVVIALPNALHAAFAIQALSAGVHVLTDKPMAISVAECERMLAVAARARRQLMVAYRLHYEKATLKVLELVRAGAIGEVRAFASTFGMQVAQPNIRLDPALGGGALFDIGIYCINAARTVFGAEPTSVYAVATHRGRRFRDVDEMTSAVMSFPGERTAIFTSSFNSAEVARVELLGTTGRIQLEQAYEEDGEHELMLSSGGRTTRTTFADRDQFAPELIAFSAAIRSGRAVEPSGREGLADLRVIEALQRSARSGQAVHLGGGARDHRQVAVSQERHRPALVRPPPLLHAAKPTRS